MLDQLSQCQQCGTGLASSQSLILQTIWCLEDASETHQKLMKKGNTQTTDLQTLDADRIFIGHNIRHALKSLFELHDLLYRRQLYGQDNAVPYSLPEIDTLPSIKALSTLRRPVLGDQPLINRFKIHPKHSHFQQLLKAGSPRHQKAKRRNVSKTNGISLSQKGLSESALAAVSEYLETKIQPIMLDVQLKDDSGEPINMSIRISDTTFQPQYKLHGMSREASNTFTETVRSQSQEKTLPPCDDLQPYIPHPERLNLIEALKQIRYFFERKWESESDPILFSESVVQCLEACERNFFLVRDQTTDSIWNVEHQEYRVEIFEESDVGLWYRSKCICVEDALHGLDAYCPRNMSFEVSDEDDNLEWNEDLQEWVKKKTPRPTSEASSDTESEADEDGDEAERIAREKELAETREKIITEINGLVGLENIKEHLQKIAARVETSTRQGVDLKEERFGTVFIGNPGTGKLTVLITQKFRRRY